jgi:hypothetical protein
MRYKAKEESRMRRQICTGAIILVILLLTLSCGGRTYFNYMPSTDLPRMVYWEDEIQSIETVSGRLYNKDVFVEITTRDGKTETGKLILIGRTDLVMSSKYYYSALGDSLVKVDVEAVVPKDEILILKVF